MATMEELPYELLYYIILLLVHSPVGAADFARILSVCRKFLLFAEDENILKLVNFDIKMELKNFYRYQNVNSLLVKCSEAGNVAAQFLLGKVILVSSSQLFLGEWQKAECDVHPCDFATLSDLRCILATNVPAQNHNVGVFMRKFLPKQVSTSEFSQTRLVHYQLVKLFLLNGSPQDFIEMGEFLRGYIKYFTEVSHSDLFYLMRKLVLQAHHARATELWAKSKESLMDAYRGLRGYLKVSLKVCKNSSEGTSRKYLDKSEAAFLLKLHLERCFTVGVCWREAMTDVDILEELWRDGMSNQLQKACREFDKIRAQTLDCFEHKLYRFRHVIHES